MNAEEQTLEQEELEEISSSYAWMLTFSDLLLLLLTLFVLKLSMSSLDGTTLHRSLSAYILGEEAYERPGGTRVRGELQVEEIELTPQTERILTAIDDGLARLAGEAQGRRESGGQRIVQDSIEVQAKAEGVLIRLSSPFPGQGTELSFRAERHIAVVAASVKEEDVELLVTAYTAGVQPEESEFLSSWELSAAQAEVIVRQMIDAGVEAQSISVFGYGNSTPLVSSTEKVADYQNRRIEIIVTAKRN